MGLEGVHYHHKPKQTTCMHISGLLQTGTVGLSFHPALMQQGDRSSLVMESGEAADRCPHLCRPPIAQGLTAIANKCNAGAIAAARRKKAQMKYNTVFPCTKPVNVTTLLGLDSCLTGTPPPPPGIPFTQKCAPAILCPPPQSAHQLYATTLTWPVAERASHARGLNVNQSFSPAWASPGLRC